MKVKKIPLRMCTGCMEMKPKKELIKAKRLSRNLDIAIDEEIYNRLRNEILNG